MTTDNPFEAPDAEGRWIIALVALAIVGLWALRKALPGIGG